MRASMLEAMEPNEFFTEVSQARIPVWADASLSVGAVIALGVLAAAVFVAHFTPFATGALFLSDLGFFLTVMLACLLLSVRTLARR